MLCICCVANLFQSRGLKMLSTGISSSVVVVAAKRRTALLLLLLCGKPISIKGPQNAIYDAWLLRSMTVVVVACNSFLV